MHAVLIQSSKENILNFGIGALSGKNVENNKIDDYLGQVRLSKG